MIDEGGRFDCSDSGQDGLMIDVGERFDCSDCGQDGLRSC